MSYVVQLWMKLMRSVRNAGSGNETPPCLPDQAVAEHQAVLLVGQFAGKAAGTRDAWKAVSNSSVIVLPIVLVRPPRCSHAEGYVRDHPHR